MIELKAQDTVMLTNDNGVKLDAKLGRHWATSNAKCQCGDILLVAPKIFDADHKKNDPVMICGDHGMHVYRFKDLVIGAQSEENTMTEKKTGASNNDKQEASEFNGAWQPIATAPRDGTEILVKDGVNGVHGAVWQDGDWYHHRNNGWLPSARYWMPLP